MPLYRHTRLPLYRHSSSSTPSSSTSENLVRNSHCEWMKHVLTLSHTTTPTIISYLADVDHDEAAQGWNKESEIRPAPAPIFLEHPYFWTVNALHELKRPLFPPPSEWVSFIFSNCETRGKSLPMLSDEIYPINTLEWRSERTRESGRWRKQTEDQIQVQWRGGALSFHLISVPTNIHLHHSQHHSKQNYPLRSSLPILEKKSNTRHTSLDCFEHA